jgi:uncharacterized PurR-regulated membrane protein YhhQ (DUF165 family)
LLIVLYLVAIVLANLSITQFGPGVAVLNAFLFIGLDLTTRDRLHEKWQGHNLWPRMLTLIAAGSLLSYALNQNAGPIALASFLAFLLSGLVDAGVYSLLHNRPYWQKVNGSNVVSALVDSLVFPLLAFGWPPLWGVIVGQFAAKVVGGWVWSLILAKRRQEVAVS